MGKWEIQLLNPVITRKTGAPSAPRGSGNARPGPGPGRGETRCTNAPRERPSASRLRSKSRGYEGRRVLSAVALLGHVIHFLAVHVTKRSQPPATVTRCLCGFPQTVGTAGLRAEGPGLPRCIDSKVTLRIFTPSSLA